MTTGSLLTEPRPEVSIILPVYHVEKYLRRALDSLLGQTFPNFELIVVNDGGTEEETAICLEYAAKDGRIVYLFQTNQGLSAARNLGLEHSRGDWIMFADSDDWVRNDFCEKALQSVTAANADMGIFDLAYTVGDSAEGYPHRVALPEGIYDSDTILKARIQGKVQCYAWNKIYRRELWDDIRFPVGDCWEDDAIIHEIIDKAKTITVIHDILYFKPDRDDSITSEAEKNNKAVYWIYRQRRRRFEYLKLHHPEMLPIARNDMAQSAIQYGRTCLLYTGDRKGYEEARAWAKNAKIPVSGMVLRIRYFMFLHCKPAFCLLERVILVLKKLKKRKA